MQFHYRFSPAMLTSIVHRATGAAMATVGAILVVWWLAAIAASHHTSRIAPTVAIAAPVARWMIEVSIAGLKR